MAHLLGAEALHLEFPTKVVFDSVTVGINQGDRVGIVGRNGAGKSRLLAMRAGLLELDAARVAPCSEVTVDDLSHTDSFDPTWTVGQPIVGDREEYEWASDRKIRDVINGPV